MKLPRPYIPLDVRLRVIARQLTADGGLAAVLMAIATLNKDSAKLAYLLKHKFGEERVHLDHDPPLCLRYRDGERYDPDANDPEHLVYRTEAEHRVKTFVRGDGAQRSDAAKRRRMLKANRPDRPKPSRWPPKGARPLQSKKR